MKRVAIIDDSKAILASVKEYIGDLVELHTFDLVDDFLNSARIDKYDMFIVDINLPEKNGLDLINEFKDYPHQRDAKIVILTAESSDKYREIAKKLGVVAYIKKPYSRVTLRNAVNAILALGGGGINDYKNTHSRGRAYQCRATG